ncbi:MAG: NAD(P)/FAD-dependent oxidoreductase [Lachnospiraceae bacterium]|nr:NAD(P)/FAD-dependent oxidoreductase [Lachnospiraceae bacterium]
MSKQVIVIGGGAAGAMAAYMAAKNGHKVTLFEKNEKIGKKIFITGKGRCNVTNACDITDFFENIPTNSKFLYSAVYSFTNQDVIDFFVEAGCPLKVERGDRVFPVSDHSSDVISALKRKLQEVSVDIKLNITVKELIVSDGKVTGVILTDGTKVISDSVIVATGGISYPTTGSTGDGYVWAKEWEHKIVEPMPALVPLETKEEWTKSLQGLSLKNVSLRFVNGKKVIYEGFGEMMFTHFGITGPLVLSASSFLKSVNGVQAFLDLKPALTKEQLDKRILREFDENKNKQFKNSINSLFPSKLVPIMLCLSGIHPDKKVNEISKEERKFFVDLIKELPMTITGTRDFKEAIITRGGISVKDINPSTMESKKIKDLYFAGEVLDVDGLTGGFNLQIAWSTGALAGNSI